jgi:hypothetical protein
MTNARVSFMSSTCPEIVRIIEAVGTKRQEKITPGSCPKGQCQVVEKVPAYRLLKNVQIQGFRNPEERGVLASTSQRRGMRETPEMGVFQQLARAISFF